MSQAVEFNLYLYSDDSCKHSIMRKSLKEKRLTKDLINICDWFVDNKYSVWGIQSEINFIYSSGPNLKLVEELVVNRER